MNNNDTPLETSEDDALPYRPTRDEKICAHATPADYPVLGAFGQESPAARDVLAERQRQKDIEEWTEEHDDEHEDDCLALAAAWYATPADSRIALDWNGVTLWPSSWDKTFFKPGDRRRELVKAGALILAEIERIDRAALRSQPQQATPDVIYESVPCASISDALKAKK